MRVREIFKSLQGEGIDVCLPTVFVRLEGCNLHPNGCSWCDTPYAQGNGGREVVSSEVVNLVERLSNGCKRVCITGGEPLYQLLDLEDLVDRFKFRDYFVEIFTNATLEPPSWFLFVDSWVPDIKCPSSGVHRQCLKGRWLEVVRDCDLVKFVVSNQEDLDYVSETLRDSSRHVPIALSPMFPNCPDSQFGEVLMSRRRWLQTVWEFCVKHNYRYSFQVHKLVYGNRRRV